MKFLTLYSLSLLLLGALCSATCPSNFPCECTEQTGYLTIECNTLDVTLDKLAQALSLLEKSNPIELTLYGLHLGSVPFNFFAGYNIRKLDLSFCQLSLSDAGGKPFTGLEDSLKELNIISTLADGKVELTHLKNLQQAEISQNSITELGNNFFPDSLLVLTIDDNSFHILGDKVLENLHNLQKLSFVRNKLSENITRSMLPNPAPALTDLALYGMSITSLPADVFTDMPQLSVLDLKKNKISIIAEPVFKPIWTQMSYINFKDNPVACDSKNDWLRHVKTTASISGECYSPPKMRGVLLEHFIHNRS